MSLFEEHNEKQTAAEQVHSTPIVVKKIDIEDQLKDELLSLTSTKKPKMFQSVTTNITSTLFLKTTRSDHDVFLMDLLEDMKTKAVKRTRFTSRVLPLKTCQATPAEIDVLAKEIINGFFEPLDGPVRYKVEAKVSFDSLRCETIPNTRGRL